MRRLWPRNRWKTFLIVVYWLVLFLVAFAIDGIVVLVVVALLFPDSAIARAVGIVLGALVAVAILRWIWNQLP
jgi:hypothetical protein